MSWLYKSRPSSTVPSKHINFAILQNGEDKQNTGEEWHRTRRKQSLQGLRRRQFSGRTFKCTYRRLKIRRIVWLVILLLCVAGTSYILRNDFVKIINRPTSTTLSTTTETSLDFPAVTVCNLNIFSATTANEVDSAVVPDLRTVFKGTPDICHNILDTYIGLEGTDFTELIKVTPQELISKCRFGGEECDISTDFVPTLTRLGVCFTFNSGQSGTPIRKANGAGVRNGLQLQLKVDQSDYIATFAGDAGLKIAVHPQSEPPLPDELGVAVPPGSNAFISFKKRTLTMKQELIAGKHMKLVTGIF